MGDGEEKIGRQAHIPVLLDQVLDRLAPGASGERSRGGRRILDGTTGLGGHAGAILSRLEPGGILVGIDRDAETLEMARARLEKICPAGARFHLFRGLFTQAQEALLAAGVDPEGGLDGILLDLGVSSYQLDSAGRGFSFIRDGPLDMRMHAGGDRTAAEWLESASVEEIERVLREFGEEPAARKIARAIETERRQRPIRSTLQLAGVIESAQPRGGDRIHPATRSFQAIRILINEELSQLQSFLWMADRHLAPQGRLVIISYHSLEDRLVKQLIQKRVKEGIFERPRPELYRPDASEIDRNPRSRSARLRWAARRG